MGNYFDYDGCIWIKPCDYKTYVLGNKQWKLHIWVEYTIYLAFGISQQPKAYFREESGFE